MVRSAIERARVLLLPWSGMLGAGFGWALTDQFGSDFTFDKCALAHPILMIAVGLIGIAIAASGGLISWRAQGRLQGARRFVAMVGGMMAALFSVAIFIQTSASLFLPRCYG